MIFENLSSEYRLQPALHALKRVLKNEAIYFRLEYFLRLFSMFQAFLAILEDGLFHGNIDAAFRNETRKGYSI